MNPINQSTKIIRTLLFTCLLAIALAACAPGSTVPPTAIPTSTAKPTLAPTATSTPEPPKIHFSEDTNCRVGPGIKFELMTVIKAGQTAQLAGQPEQGNYWVVTNPNGAGMCWVVRDFATPSGATDKLTVMVAPPTSSPTSTSTPRPTPSVVECSDCKIAYLADSDGFPRLYTMNEDGSKPTLITPKDLDAVYGFALSPDGHRVAFQSGSQVYTMNLDGSNLVALAKDGAPKVYRSFMSWSPDGSRIAFTFRNNLDNNRAIQIYVANADGSDLVNLGQNLVPDSAIAWSPDGSKIAFAASVESGPVELHTIQADGANAAIIAFLGTTSSPFAWSPDGSQFFFQYCKYGTCYPFLFLIAADGHEQSPRQLPQQSLKGNLSSPTWSPDGSKIAFALSSRDDTKPEIAVLNIDGENISPLTQNSKWDNLSGITWSPGGSKIAFKAGQGGNEYLYRINADGSKLTKLTKRPGVVYSQIAWVPVSSAAFAPESTAVAAPTIPAPTVLMAYPGHENCTIQINTQAWKIGDYWKQNILGQKDNTSNQAVLVSNNFLIYLLEHQAYPGCQVAWAPAVGFEGLTSKESFETINAKKWKIWNVENNAIRVYFLTELDIRFMQTAPDDDTQRQGCTKDVYQILESLACEPGVPTSTPMPTSTPASGGG